MTELGVDDQVQLRPPSSSALSGYRGARGVVFRVTVSEILGPDRCGSTGPIKTYFLDVALLRGGTIQIQAEHCVRWGENGET